MTIEDDDCDCESREEVYDSHIAPLVTEILEICKARGISMVAAFGIASEEAPELMVTTAFVDETCVRNDSITVAYHVLSGETSPSLVAANRRQES